MITDILSYFIATLVVLYKRGAMPIFIALCLLLYLAG